VSRLGAGEEHEFCADRDRILLFDAETQERKS
jgi:hypothetical protein